LILKIKLKAMKTLIKEQRKKKSRVEGINWKYYINKLELKD
jgi:hypothetical protein